MINKKRLSLFIFALFLLTLFSNLNAQLLSAPTTTTEYYSRDYLVRSIIKGGEFTRGVGMPEYTSLETTKHTPITAHEYFGIREEGARAFRIDDDTESCAQSFNRAILNNETDYNIAASCTEVTDRFGDEPPSNTTVTYAWGQVNSDGVLTSAVVEFDVRVVPEINFTGQSSYVYDQEAFEVARDIDACITRNMLQERDRDCETNIIATDINAEAYLGRDTDISDNIFNDISLHNFIRDGAEGFSGDLSRLSLSEPTTTNGVIKYNIPLSIINSNFEDLLLLTEQEPRVINELTISDVLSALSPRLTEGKTLVVLLDRGVSPDRSMNPDLYGLPRKPAEGGANIPDDLDYLVGPNNVVEIERSDDPFIRMRNINLFEYDFYTDSIGTTPVITVAEGKTYYIVASYLTNIDEDDIQVDEMDLDEGIEIVELSTTTRTSLLREAIEFDDLIFDNLGNTTYTLIPFKVTTSPSGNKVTLGWDRIGNREFSIENVSATYRVTPDSYVIRNDIDGDRISDEIEPFVMPGVNTSLFVEVRESRGTIDVLTTDNSDNYVYVSDAGLILATTDTDSTLSLRDFSPANIAYSSIDSTTKELLEYDDDSTGEPPIETIATFAARSIPYSIPTTPTRSAGGLVHTVFPMESSSPTETLYLSRYNNEDGRWENFERNTEDRDAETWYAIDWTSERRSSDPGPQRCPTSVELYKYEHNFATTTTLVATEGFEASDHNCIMLVTKDGSPYDNSIDGSVSEQIAVGRQPFVDEEDEEIEIESMQCAAFYPNIGQTELFFQLVTGSADVGDVNLSALELMQNSSLGLIQNANTLTTPNIVISGPFQTSPSMVVFRLTAELQNLITSDSPITATYTQGTQGDTSAECMANVNEDSDEDNTPDIVDPAPFDPNDSIPNPDLTTSTFSQFNLKNEYFSRDTLVPHLLSREEFPTFNYVYIDEENGTLVREDFTSKNAMSEMAYFGVSTDARVFRVSAGQCKDVLDAFQKPTYRLSMVQIGALCTEVTGELHKETEPSTNNYVWVELALNDDGTTPTRLASRSEIYEVKVLPELNFDSPELIRHDVPTTTRLVISRDPPPPGTQLREVELSRDTEQFRLIFFDGTTTTATSVPSGVAGTTVTYWLSGPSTGASSVWTPTTPSSVLQPMPGGHPSITSPTVTNLMYAVGRMNHIAIRVAAADEPTRIESMQCAAFYPNIGQTELFFQLVTGSADVGDVNLSALELMQNSSLGLIQNANTLTTPNIVISGPFQTSPSMVVFRLMATLRDEITSDLPITATYTQGTQGDASAECMASLDENSDNDTNNIPDIVDKAPFDPTDNEPNDLTSTPSTLTLNKYFSRDTLVPHLLEREGEEFTTFSYAYIDNKNDNNEENDELIREDFTSEDAMSEAEYFGVRVSEDTIVFRVSEECERVLRAVEAHNLAMVQIRAFCKDEVEEVDDKALGRRNKYVWVELDGNNRLESKSIIYDVLVLPGFNFGSIAENSLIVYAVPTTTTIGISREDSPGPQSNDVQLRRDTEQPISIRLEDDGTATYDAPSGPAGTTVTYWLSGSDSVWAPRGDELEEREGGYSLARFMYAVGPMSRIDIKVEVTTVTYINQILLYEVVSSTITLVPSMIAGRNYYIVAEYTTNKPSIPITSSSTIIDNETTTTLIRDTGHLKGQMSRIAIIQVSAEELGTETEKTQTEGWDRIGRIENVEATYLVTSAGARPPIYNSYADIDRDRIDNTLDSSDPVTRLPVIIDGRVRDVNILQTSEGYPLFMSDVGILIALGKGSDEEDYSAANIKDNEIDQTTRDFLGDNFSEEPSLIETIATFGVETGRYSGDRGMIASITFPVQSSEGIKQIRRYNRNMNTWEQFRRTTPGHPDTWYAIPRTNTNAECEDDDVDTYIAEHQAASNSGQNCIMLVISDGGPYDNSGLDGRIIGLFSLGPPPPPPPMMPPPMMPPPMMPDTPPSSRRGSAVSVGDILLLIGALALLIGAANQRQRRRRHIV